jgi:hypothetical protein
MWEISQITPLMVQIDSYLLNIKMRALLELVEHELNMTREEIEVYFKQAVLDQLKQDRKMITRARAQSLPPNGEVTNPFRGIFGPDGNPL